MNPWVMFGIGVAVGLLIGIFVGGLGKAVKDDEFNEQGEYECKCPADESMEIGTVIPSNGSTLLEPPLVAFPTNIMLDMKTPKDTIYGIPITPRLSGESNQEYIDRIARRSVLLKGVRNGDFMESKD